MIPYRLDCSDSPYQFLSYFTGPILYGKPIASKVSLCNKLKVSLVMEIAVLLAAGLRDWVDFGVIIAILMLNATVGWYQEKQAADVVASLKGDIAMRATVVRDGKEEDIKARVLVPGVIVSLDPHSQNLFSSHEVRSLSRKYR